MASTTQKFVIGGVVLVGVLLLISERSGQTISGAGSCTVRVTVDTPLRSQAEDNAPEVGTLKGGAQVLAERRVTNDFRQLGPSIWAAQGALDPTPAGACD